MKGFIEVANLEDQTHRLIAVSSIANVGPGKYANRGTYISTVGGGCFVTSDSYEKVKAKIEEASREENAALRERVRVLERQVGDSHRLLRISRLFRGYAGGPLHEPWAAHVATNAEALLARRAVKEVGRG